MTAPVVTRATESAPGAARSGQPRVLIAPITVTPSKPLTPSHLKGLLWADVMYRATGLLADTTFRYSHTTYHLTEQTLGFWEFLDRTEVGRDYADLGEDEIGALYVRYRAADERVPAAALRPYTDAVEEDGWVHPAARRVLDLWSGHYARLGMHDPGLVRHQPPRLGQEEMLTRLESLGMCLQQRELGGPCYLDLTEFGLPLRQIVTADGRPNYLACALRELIPLASHNDEVVLLYDRELDADYQLLERVLSACGPVVRRVPVGRVPIDGRIRSARHGDWRGLDAATLLDTAATDHGPAATRLGMRLYFIATLGPGQQQSFRPDLLRQCLNRAERLLASHRPEAAEDLAARIGGHRREHLYADPYRLTSGLLARHRPAPSDDLLKAVFL